MDSNTIEALLAYGFSAIVVVSGCGFIACRQPVHSALNFTAAVLASSGLYLLQDAPYVAAAMVAVYAGATIIIFLFALMFAQQSRLPAYDLNLYHPKRSLLTAGMLATILIYAIGTRNEWQPVASMVDSTAASLSDSSSATSDNNSPAVGSIDHEATPRSSVKVVDLGRVMYTRYLWAMELAGTLLLVATIGAILMAERDPVAQSTAGGPIP